MVLGRSKKSYQHSLHPTYREGHNQLYEVVSPFQEFPRESRQSRLSRQPISQKPTSGNPTIRYRQHSNEDARLKTRHPPSESRQDTCNEAMAKLSDFSIQSRVHQVPHTISVKQERDSEVGSVVSDVSDEGEFLGPAGGSTQHGFAFEQSSSSRPAIYHDPTWGITTTVLDDGVVDWPSDEEGNSRGQKGNRIRFDVPPKLRETFSDTAFGVNFEGMPFWSKMRDSERSFEELDMRFAEDSTQQDRGGFESTTRDINLDEGGTPYDSSKSGELPKRSNSNRVNPRADPYSYAKGKLVHI